MPASQIPMDRVSNSPVESRDRAVSSEPCSTRPNPFDNDDGSSARKRRRTSLNGVSRSRSVESHNSSRDTSALAEDERTGQPVDQGIKMTMDSSPSKPHTPERQQQHVQPLSESKPTKITLNLRNKRHPPQSTPSPPTSFKDADAELDASHENGIRTSVEDPELDVSISLPYFADAASPPSDIDDRDGPHIEVIDDNEVSQLADLQHIELQFADPVPDFPRGPGESVADALQSICCALPTHREAAPKLCRWIESYLAWAQGLDFYSLFQHYEEYRDFWKELPRLIWENTTVGRGAPARSPHITRLCYGLHKVLAKLTAFFVDLDQLILHSVETGVDLYNELTSPIYIMIINQFLMEYGGQGCNMGCIDTDSLWPEHVCGLIDAFRSSPPIHGSHPPNNSPCHLGQLMAGLVPRIPRLVDHLHLVAQLAAYMIRDTAERLQLSQPTREAEEASAFLEQGYLLSEALSKALEACIEKSVNQIQAEVAESLMFVLTGLLRLCLRAECGNATTAIREHQRKHPDIPRAFSTDVMVDEWRLKTLTKFIMSSQMQLRLLAAQLMCSDLVRIFKEHSGNNIEPSQQPLLHHFSNTLLQSGVVTYILGPTCHPEVTTASANIIGFLFASHTFTEDHLDFMWQTMTTCQISGVSESLSGMFIHIVHLFSAADLLAFCRKVQAVPIEAFSPTVKDLCVAVINQLCQKHDALQELLPYSLMFRLLRESSAIGPPFCHVVQKWAAQTIPQLLKFGPSYEDKALLYQECLRELAQKTRFALGSIHCLSFLCRPIVRELQLLTSQHDLPRLLIDELEHAISIRQDIGKSHVISGPENKPRLEMLVNIVYHQPEALSGELGRKLWELLVGKRAASQEDRNNAWQSLNTAFSSRPENQFLDTCFNKYLPTLAPELFCNGSLQFALQTIMHLVDEKDSIILDDDDSSERQAIEQLWTIALTAPTNTIEQQAIKSLVKGVYIDSRCIQQFSRHRARKVHLALVNRCLGQLSLAAKRLKTAVDGSSEDSIDAMDINYNGSELFSDPKLLFSRSLQILRSFHEHYQAAPHFSTPDMRSLVLPKNIDVQGLSAELKFQSFDGDRQTEVKPLPIGRENTAGSLLASIRDATGFNNYRLYYKGQALTPSEQDICRSLEELGLENGLILVKRESETIEQPLQVRPGASAVEIEILRHFEELWQYLGLEETLAAEIYAFLNTLPVDDRIIAAIEKQTVNYREVFAVGQPLKSLYAIYAIQEYLNIQRSLAKSSHEHGSYHDASVRALRLVVSAISDREVADQNSSDELRIRLASQLVEQLLSMLRDPSLPSSVPECLDITLLERLIEIMSFCMEAHPTVSSANLLTVTFQAILDTCSLRAELWNELCSQADVKSVIRRLLLDDPRGTLRKSIALAIGEKTVNPLSTPAVAEPVFRDFFWTLLIELIPHGLTQPTTCSELFHLAVALFKSMRDSGSHVLDLPRTVQFLGRLLLDYRPQEDIIQPGAIDLAAQGLVNLLHFILCDIREQAGIEILPPSFATQLFWHDLFPRRWSSANSLWQGDVIYNEVSRCQLIDIILKVAGRTPEQVRQLIEDLRSLVSCMTNDEIEDGLPYQYDLPLNNFERFKAIRSHCGYAGLRNLSNTCYLNSLCTQLFMNIDFRQFMLSVEVSGEKNQSLLYHTQRMFGQLQSSHHRWIDPEAFVASIKTYDDDLINIHNQMDVEEFFNLLNDRWEGQLRSQEAVQRFRSFYGGRLVTQTKSKECEHISEVMEPFSAIQCDIKGKKDLLESLDAYVDGEHMEGDNKYNCTTCGRHVDAVRRSCLKQIPDSLIFHLKRFDFNLRTLARNKINDYFAFPDRIDMRPYTIEHLSNPAGDSSEDWFELVGVLVHAGTAESGHYYSFIRERPTSRATQDWFEFNDDNVTPWNASRMDASCFGGTEPSWDAGGVAYEKNYCAYMLFYERSSALERKNHELQRSGLSSPVQAPMPAILTSAIREDNLRLLQRHCLFDPHHVRLVDGAIERMLELKGGICSEIHETETSAVEMALGHLDQVASRAKDIPDAQRLADRLKEMATSCAQCAFAVYEYFSNRHEPFRTLVQRNSEPEIRQSVSDLFMIALQSIKETFPGNYSAHRASPNKFDNFEENVVSGVGIMFDVLWENFHIHLKSWFEVFHLMARFVDLGKEELLSFLGHDFLHKTILIIVAENLTPQELDQQFMRLSNTLARRQNRPPAFSTIMDLLNSIFASVTVDNPVKTHRFREEQHLRQPESPIRLTMSEVSQMQQRWDGGCSIFLDKLIYINQNPEATDSIFVHILKRGRSFEDDVLETLLVNTQVQHSFIVHAPYLRVAALYCQYSREPENIDRLIEHVARNSNVLANSEPKAVLGFFTHKAVIDGHRENSGETKKMITIQCLEYLPLWVPGLLAHYDHNISNEVKQVLEEKIFRHGRDPAFEEKHGGQERAEAVVRSARRIGLDCLYYVHENYIKRGTSVPAQTVVVLQSVFEQCGSYFDAADDAAGGDSLKFFRNRQVVLESLRRLSVDDLEDDGSDWENSVASSDQMDSLGDDENRDVDA